MFRPLKFVVLGLSLLAMSSCACTERSNHAVRKMWADYNTLRCPAFYLEQEDHLPYPAAQVGYYRWMYDKDPGHQLACLGPIPPRTCGPCDPVPPRDEPFEYEVLFPTAIPRHSDQLWGSKLPEPINTQPTPTLADGPPGLEAAPSNSRPGLVPILPPLSRPINPPPPNALTVPPPPAAGAELDTGRRDRPPARLPSFDVTPPPPKPLDDTPPPIQGPGSQQRPNVKLTSGQDVPDLDSSPGPADDWSR